MLHKFTRLTAAVSACLYLTACGSGSDSSAEPSAEPTNQQAQVNNSPVLSATAFAVQEDSTLTNTVTATDADGDSLSFSLVKGAAHGQVTLEANGDFSYQPQANYFGDDSFEVEVSDGTSQVKGLVQLAVAGVNDKPEVVKVTTYTRAQQSVSFTLSASDVDGDKLSYTLSQLPSKGTAELSEDNVLTYTPGESAQGIDDFIVAVSDGLESVALPIAVDNGLAFQGKVNLTGTELENTRVLLEGANGVEQVTLESTGEFKVYGLVDGDYRVKVRKPGYRVSQAQQVQILPLENGEGAPEIKQLNFELRALDNSHFSYHWSEDQSTAGTDYSATINQPVEVEFSEQTIAVVDEAAANELQHDYNIVLTDEQGSNKWTQEHAYRILQTMKSIPQQTRNPYRSQSLQASKWLLTEDFLEDDIQVSNVDGFRTVLISEAAFANAGAKLATVEGKRGVYYSQKLHHALVRFVTDNGRDKVAYEKILTERYGVTTEVADYSVLTANTTGGEPSSRFQSFHSEEIVQIINMFEEMPAGVHTLPELKYLVRRLDGQSHPLYPEAPAVAWPTEGYIEFMDTAFTSASVEHMHRLVIHEKAHFLWQHQFDQQLKNDWIELGGWFEDASSPSGWATTKQTEFVSAYAHQGDPNEDMAESISYFVLNPDKLKSRAAEKYEFIRDRIMQGNIYLSTIREDLTFQVYNLYPDYVFPGKIKRVDIAVEGQPEQDKKVNIEIELHGLDGELEGAENAYMRIFSDVGTFVDMYLYPEQGETGTVLAGSFELSKHAKAGYWRTNQIVLTDAVGNQRFERANDFGWKLFVNNSQEDVTAPSYVLNSLALSKSTTELEGQQVQVLSATWSVDEDIAMAQLNACHANINDEVEQTYRYEATGTFNQQTQKCETELLLPDYMPSSNYSVAQVTMKDSALNRIGVYFTDPNHAIRDDEVVVDEVSPSIAITTANPDLEHPELDLNSIEVTAQPSNPEQPNGETLVTISFRVRDNISGYNLAYVSLRDPQGIAHEYWAYNEGSWSIFPTEDATQWTTYTRSILLPIGSAPGTWGLSEMTVYDRANNFKAHDFTEIVHFDVLD